MKWARFKELVEAAGVTDGMVIDWIDVSADYDGKLTVGLRYLCNSFTVAD